jgi:flagellar biosynthesis protein FlhA
MFIINDMFELINKEVFMSNNTGLANRIKVFLPAFIVIFFILGIVFPLPAFAVDIFIGFNLLFALLILVIVLYTKKTVGFSLFPTIILCSAVFTLILSISAARLILTKGNNNGWFIHTISNFFIGIDNVIRLYVSFGVFVIFISLIVIVISRSCYRVREVAARYTLDTMQIKIMGIETDLSLGAITEDKANILKDEIRAESDFLGSLDGAMQFVSGNVKVCIFILIIVIIGGGSVINILIRSDTIIEAIHYYMRLSIGCGILFLFPSFLVSLAVGIIVTRKSIPDD